MALHFSPSLLFYPSLHQPWPFTPQPNTPHLYSLAHIEQLAHIHKITTSQGIESKPSHHYFLKQKHSYLGWSNSYFRPNITMYEPSLNVNYSCIIVNMQRLIRDNDSNVIDKCLVIKPCTVGVQ